MNWAYSGGGLNNLNKHMRKNRKTIPVEAIKDTINTRLAFGGLNKLQRLTLIMLADDLLMSHGVYHGYQHLRKDQVPEGEKPGINAVTGQSIMNMSIEDRFNDTDDTRIYFC